MADWIKGNKPYSEGLYWVTVNEAGQIKIYDEPMYYDNGKWYLEGKPYFPDNIMAHIRCNKPSEPYNELHIGYPDKFYIRVKCNGITSYLSKGLRHVGWSKIGYSTKDKAFAAMKRYIKLEQEQGYKESECCIVNGNGEVIKE